MTIRRFLLLAVVGGSLVTAVVHANPSAAAFVNEASSLVMNRQSIRVAVQKQLAHRGDAEHKAATDERKAPSAPQR